MAKYLYKTHVPRILNYWAFCLDYSALHHLFTFSVECNEALAKNPYTRRGGEPRFDLMVILNSAFDLHRTGEPAFSNGIEDSNHLEFKLLADPDADPKLIHSPVVAKVLNEALQADSNAVNVLFKCQAECGRELRSVEGMQTLGGSYLRPLGLLNALFGCDSQGRGSIIAILSKDMSRIDRFDVFNPGQNRVLYY